LSRFVYKNAQAIMPIFGGFKVTCNIADDNTLSTNLVPSARYLRELPTGMISTKPGARFIISGAHAYNAASQIQYGGFPFVNPVGKRRQKTLIVSSPTRIIFRYLGCHAQISYMVYLDRVQVEC
jgi:hypothetical protein